MIRSEEKERAGSPNNEIKVLLVEDNPGDVGLMRANLDDSRYHSVSMLHADRLQAAVEMVLSEQPDAILLDLGLPDSSGLDTVDSMVKAAGPIPIVVLTGYSDESLGLEAVSRGAQDYLVKGEGDSVSLERSLRYSIQRRRALEELRESNQRYHSLFNDNHAVMIMIDRDTGPGGLQGPAARVPEEPSVGRHRPGGRDVQRPDPNSGGRDTICDRA